MEVGGLGIVRYFIYTMRVSLQANGGVMKASRRKQQATDHRLRVKPTNLRRKLYHLQLANPLLSAPTRCLRRINQRLAR
jgi:hypothetical protein